jgi:hypothetical protein
MLFCAGCWSMSLTGSGWKSIAGTQAYRRHYGWPLTRAGGHPGVALVALMPACGAEWLSAVSRQPSARRTESDANTTSGR